MIAARPRVVIALSYDQDVVRWRRRFAAGEVLDATPYGYDRAGDRYSLAWTASHEEGPLEGRLRRALAARLGFDLVHAWRNRALLRSADVIWTHTEREHLAIAAVLGRSGPPVLAQSVWLWDEWSSMGPLRRRLAAALLRRHPIEVLHSRANASVSRRVVPGRRVEVVPFGSQTLPRSAPPPAAARPLVLAVGNDVHRDWATLAAAASSLPHLRVLVVSGSRRAREVDWPESVELRTSITRDELRAAFDAASCAVVPLRPNRHASGSTSCIEALGAGRPLVVSSAGGIGDYVDGSARLVRPGDTMALAAALDDASTGRIAAPAEDAVEARGLTQADYVERYVRITEWLLGGAWDERITAFASLRAPRST